MNTPIAIGLGLVVLAFFLGDALLYHGQASIFLASQTVDLIDWVAFWR